MTTAIEVLRWLWVTAHAREILPIGIALVALFLNLRDRRPRLRLRERKGQWYKLKSSLNRKEVIFEGMIETYNVSARANAIRSYEFWCKRTKDSGWEAMESGYYRTSEEGGEEMKYNITPVTVAPYSGQELRVMAMMSAPQPYEMSVRVEVEDLFGKRYRVEVTAKS